MAKKIDSLKTNEVARGNRVSQDQMANRVKSLEACIMNGIIRYQDLVKVTGMTESQVQYTLRINPPLHASYKAALKAIKFKAVDNFISALTDNQNPNQFEATKIFLKRYKTDLDDAFETKEGEGVSIGLEGEASGRVLINFTPQNK